MRLSVGVTRSAMHSTHKKVCRLIKFCALNGQIILIINLLPKQLAINYNLMMNYLLLTAWGKRRNQTLIIHWVIKFIGASASAPFRSPHLPIPRPLERGGTGGWVGVQSLDQVLELKVLPLGGSVLLFSFIVCVYSCVFSHLALFSNKSLK